MTAEECAKLQAEAQRQIRPARVRSAAGRHLRTRYFFTCFVRYVCQDDGVRMERQSAAYDDLLWRHLRAGSPLVFTLAREFWVYHAIEVSA